MRKIPQEKVKDNNKKIFVGVDPKDLCFLCFWLLLFLVSFVFPWNWLMAIGSVSTFAKSFFLLIWPIFKQDAHRNSWEAFLWFTRDVHNPIPGEQMSYINLSVKKPSQKTERKRRRGGKKKRTKEWSRRLFKGSRLFHLRPHVSQCKRTHKRRHTEGLQQWRG